MASSASSLAGLPVASSTSVSGPMSTTSAWKTDATSRTCERTEGSVRTFTRASSRSTAASSVSSTTLSTRMSLFSCSVTCCTGVDAPSTTIVMRLTRSSCVGPTASDEMLNARRENRPATCASTPGLFSTRTDSVWVLTAPSPPCGWRPAAPCWPGGTTPRSPPQPRWRAGIAREDSSRDHLSASCGLLLVCAEFGAEHDVVVGPACGHHREDAFPVVHPEVDHGGHVRHGKCLVQHGVHVVGPLAAQPGAAVGLGELDVVRDGGAELDVGVALVVEQLLPLAHHAEEAVVEDQDLDRQLLDRAGREFLRGHLEAAVTVDRYDKLTRPADLGAHRGRHGESHRAQAAGVDPGPRLGERVVLG